MDNICEGFNDEDIIINAQIKRFKDIFDNIIFEDQSISLEIAANKATQIKYANNDPILIDTAKQIDFTMFEGGGNEIWSLHDFAPVGTIIMNKDGTPLGVIRNIYGVTCYIDNEI